MSTSNVNHRSVPKQYAGKWIAWTHDLARIIACGDSPKEVKDTARAAGELRPVLAKSPPANVRLVGVRAR